jgi:hypothetical protein
MPERAAAPVCAKRLRFLAYLVYFTHKRLCTRRTALRSTSLDAGQSLVSS